MRIQLDGLTKRYGKVRALDDVSLSIDPGQIVALLGANGAGKTTLLRCLGGIVAPDSGSILYDGTRFTRDGMELRQRLAFLPDFPMAFAHATVLRHIGMVLRLYGVDGTDVEDRVMKLLRGFEIMPLIDTPMGRLSRGQVYKAALAALLATAPEIVLLDEPMASGMDPNGISFLKSEARAAAKRGATIIYSTQILEVAEKFSDRVCVIDRGKVQHFAPVAELETTVAGSAGDGVLERIFGQLRESAQ